MLLKKILASVIRAAPRPAIKHPERRFVLVLMCPSVGRHLEVFREVIETVAVGLSGIGYASTTTINEFSSGARHIVFCPRLLHPEDVDDVPPSTILYNFEPLDLPVFDSRKAFLTHYAPRFQVWDYSASNVQYLASRGIRARHVPLGYAPCLTRIERARAQDIDVLFYGEMSARRVHILDALRTAGLNVFGVSDVYGDARDALIARANVVLNVHNRDDARALETPRVFYLLANRKAVVTEIGPGVVLDQDLGSAMCAVPYERLTEACVELVADPVRRAALEEAGFECIKRRDEARILAAALAAPE